MRGLGGALCSSGLHRPGGGVVWAWVAWLRYWGSGWGGRGDSASRISCAPRPWEGQLEGRSRQNRRLPTVESVSPSAQPLYTLVPALFTCSEKSDRVVCEMQARAGARWRCVSHQHHHLRGHVRAHGVCTVALATTLTGPTCLADVPTRLDETVCRVCA